MRKACISLAIVVALGCLMVSLLALAAAAADACTPEDVLAGKCTVNGHVDDDGVFLTGEQDQVGGSGSGDIDESAPTDDPFADCYDPYSTTCARPYIVTVTSPVTLSDIATFHPTPAVDHSQPHGWAIIGLDTNFYATGGRHTVDGTLLGKPASVRFTPVHWTWDYGDNTTASRTVPGATWKAQSIHEFDPTPTSHIYRQRGTVTINLDVAYTAEYRYDQGPWIPITGTLTLPANPLTITVGDAKTVLVEHNCRQNRAGPGC
ncbi:hypothetical protein BH11ACT5_BH11ACT5_17250 [soil metagenome]